MKKLLIFCFLVIPFLVFSQKDSAVYQYNGTPFEFNKIKARNGFQLVERDTIYGADSGSFRYFHGQVWLKQKYWQPIAVTGGPSLPITTKGSIISHDGTVPYEVFAPINSGIKTILTWSSDNVTPGLSVHDTALQSITYGRKTGDLAVYDPDGNLTNMTPPEAMCNDIVNVQISYVSDTTFTYPAVPFTINCVTYNLPGGIFKIPSGNAGTGEHRDDLVFVNSSGLHTKTGDNSVGGIDNFPQLDDPANDRFVTYIRIDENNAVPSNISQDIIYYDNLSGEYTHTTFGSITAAFNYGTNPQTGDSSIRITAATNNSGIRFNWGFPLSRNAEQKVTLWIRNNATFATNRNWVLRLINNATQTVGSVPVTLGTTQGYVKAVGNYLQISIPLDNFGGVDVFNGIEIRNTGTGGTVNVQIDNIKFEKGIATTTNATGLTDWYIRLDTAFVVQNGLEIPKGFLTNIYNSNGNFLSDRTIYADGHSLQINGLNFLQFNSGSGSLSFDGVSFNVNFGGGAQLNINAGGISLDAAGSLQIVNIPITSDTTSNKILVVNPTTHATSYSYWKSALASTTIPGNYNDLLINRYGINVTNDSLKLVAASGQPGLQIKGTTYMGLLPTNTWNGQLVVIPSDNMAPAFQGGTAGFKYNGGSSEPWDAGSGWINKFYFVHIDSNVNANTNAVRLRFNTLMHRESILNYNSNITFTFGNGSDWVWKLGSLTPYMNSQNSDGIAGFRSRIVIQHQTGYSGSSIVQTGINGNAGFAIGEYPSLNLSVLEMKGSSGTGHSLKMVGGMAGYMSYILSDNGNADTATNWAGFVSSGGGSLIPHVPKWIDFHGGLAQAQGISGRIDTALGIYIYKSNVAGNPTRNLLYGPTAIDTTGTLWPLLALEVKGGMRFVDDSVGVGKVLQDIDGNGKMAWRTVTVSGGGGTTTNTLSVSGAISYTSGTTFDGSAARTLQIANAAADGSTLGAAAFNANDFNSSSGVITIDYTNAQKATSGQPGFLTSADWTTFNGKISANQTITLSGDISGSGTTAITTTIGALKVTNAMLAGSITAAKLVGSDITVVGTIGTGTWQGTAIADTYIASAATWNAKLSSIAVTTPVTSATAGSVFFAGTAGVLQQSNANFFYDSTNVRIGISTNAPTHGLTFGSASTDMAFYNTIDQVTNYERTRIYWDGSNVFHMEAENGGTGTQRRIQINASVVTLQAAGNTKITLQPAALTGQVNFPMGSSTANTTGVGINGAFTATSGTANALAVIGTINNSSTAGDNQLLISPFYQGVGGGTHYLINAGTNTASGFSGTHTMLFSVDNAGKVVGGTYNGLTITTTTGTLTLANGMSFISSGSNAVTMTSTGTTNFTLPTGTGTLAYLAGANNWTGIQTFTNGVTTGTTSTSGHVLAFNSLTTGTGMYVSSSTISSGNLLNLVTTGTAASGSNSGLVITRSGANATNAITVTGAKISVTNTNATSGTNVGIDITASGATTNNFSITAAGAIKMASTTLFATAVAGSYEYNGSNYQTKASGLRYGQGGIIATFSTDVSNSSTTETDMYSYTTQVSTLANTGEMLEAEFYVKAITTNIFQLQTYFAGTGLSSTIISPAVGDMTRIFMSIIRTGSTTARVIIHVGLKSSASNIYEVDMTGLTFTNTNILKFTVTGAASTDETAKFGVVKWNPVAAN